MVEGKEEFYKKAEEALKRSGYQYYGEKNILGIGIGHSSKPDYIAVPGEVMEAALLTSYAWEASYSGLIEAVTVEEYHEALRQAELFVRWAVRVIKESL